MDLKKKQKVLRLIPNGMFIFTSRVGEKYGAATITWVTQVAFKPPLIAAAIRPDSTLFECLKESKEVVVHVLSVDQQDLARRFFSSTEMNNGTLNGEPTIHGTTSAPILKNVPSYAECRVTQIVDDGGDHQLVILEVVEVEHLHDVKPLLVANTPWTYGG
jgi:flavin reductase (DIM6/NTAB) family NADH-FMN oxidoreductase RutF